jgi:hypothetical protein
MHWVAIHITSVILQQLFYTFKKFTLIDKCSTRQLLKYQCYTHYSSCESGTAHHCSSKVYWNFREWYLMWGSLWFASVNEGQCQDSISDCSSQNLTVFIINDLIITSIQLHLTIPATQQLSVIHELLFLRLLCRSLSAQSTSIFQSVRLTAFMHNGMKFFKSFNVSVLP